MIHIVSYSHPVLVEVETSCKSLTTSPNKQFTVTCTARAEIDGQSVSLDIEWTRINLSLTDSSNSGPALTEKCQEQNAVECRGNITATSGSPVTIYQSILTATENYTDIIIYQCTARLINDSIFNDTANVTVFVKGTMLEKILIYYVSVHTSAEMEGISGSESDGSGLTSGSGSAHIPDSGSDGSGSGSGSGSGNCSGLTSGSGSGHTPDCGSGNGSGLTSGSGSGHTPDCGSGNGSGLTSGSGSGHTPDRGSGDGDNGSGLMSGFGSGHTPDCGSGNGSGLTSGSGSGHIPDRGSGDGGNGSGLINSTGSTTVSSERYSQ